MRRDLTVDANLWNGVRETFEVLSKRPLLSKRRLVTPEKAWIQPPSSASAATMSRGQLMNRVRV